MREEYNETQELAIFLHDYYCNQSHEDNCGWYYEMDNNDNHDWSGYAHKNWVERARSLFSIGLEYDDIIKTLAQARYIEDSM